MIKVNDIIICQPLNDQNITVLKDGDTFILDKNLLFAWIDEKIKNNEIKKFGLSKISSSTGKGEKVKNE